MQTLFEAEGKRGHLKSSYLLSLLELLLRKEEQSAWLDSEGKTKVRRYIA